MEIRLKATVDTPYYLAELAVSREGDTIIFQVVDEKNREKARFDIGTVHFNLIADVLLTASGEKEDF